MNKFFAFTIPAMTVVLFAGWANASEVIQTETAKACPAGSAIAQSAKINADGSIVITTRCVKASK
jgi:hypothetical protein